MNLEFKSLKVKNFLSFGNKEETFDLDFGGVTNLKGQNLDVEVGKDNSSRNGTGKTTCLQGVVYALYGKGIEEGMKQDEFINLTNGKKMRVELNFTVDSKECTIIRTRKPNGVQFFVDGDDLSRDSIANTNELIEKTIGVNYDTFVVSFLMTNGVKPVLSRKPAEQRDFFENLLNMDLLTTRAESIKSIKSDLKVDLKLIQKDIDYAETTNQKADETYEKTKQRYHQYEEERKETIEDLANKLEKCKEAKDFEKRSLELFETIKNIRKSKNEVMENERKLNSSIYKESQFISDSEKEIGQKNEEVERQKMLCDQHITNEKSLQDDLKELEQSLEELSPKCDQVNDYLDLKEKKGQNEEVVDRLEEEISKLLEKVDEWQKEVDHLEEGNCPYCKQQWNSEEQRKKIQRLNQKIEEYNNDVTKKKGLITSTNKSIEDLDKKIQKYDLDDEKAEEIVEQYESEERKKNQKEEQLEEERKKKERAEKRIEEAERFINEELDSLKQKVEESKKNLENMEAELKQDKAEIGELEDQQYKVEQQIKELPIQDENEFNKAISYYDNYKDQLKATEIAVNPFEEDFNAGPQGKVNVDEKLAEKASMESKVSHCDYMVKLLTDSKSFIRKSIINCYVPYLNKKINTYAESLDSPHFTEIQPDLTVNVEYMRKSVSYHSLSAGERLRLNVSVSLALRDLMATLGTSSNFLMVDELFDSSLDSNGKNNVFKTIKDRLKNIILVSHSGEFDDKCDRVITAVKQNGFTHLEK